MELPSDIYGQLEELSNAGNDLVDDENYSLAIGKWMEALTLLPEPKSARVGRTRLQCAA